VELVNGIKDQISGTSGGSFSINEHGQVIARTRNPRGQGNTVHAINVDRGSVTSYTTPIIFDGGRLSPLVEPREGQSWTGPLSGMTYRFAALGNPKPPSRNLDEIFVVEEGEILQISRNASIRPYPPVDGSLCQFLKALRRQLPDGGRFRVNEHGRAFTSNGSIFIGTIPQSLWFRPLTARS
jgi:hypothetical protein